jgi:ubiquinone/menaquinone biosynthesis C-methylase UbiE
MSNAELKAQIEAATVYEAFFVPALFEQWTTPMLDSARVAEGDRLLDVGCGTGVLARAAVERVGPTGSVIGLDNNAAMLSVAAQIAPHITWKEGAAEALPFEDASFDIAASQFGLMFFDRTPALHEMMRVLKPGGRLVASVWDRLENVPAYSILIAMLQHMVGRRAADALRTPFVLGDMEKLQKVYDDAGIACEIETHEGTARYPSVRSWVLTDVKGWFPLVDVVLDKEEYDGLLDEAEHALHAFVQPNGSVVFPITVHIASSTR